MARSPASIPGLLRWGRADDAGVADGAIVTSIPDRVSGSTYSTLGVGGAGPAYSASSALGGRPALVFDSVRINALRDSVGLAVPSSGWTVWAVSRRTTGGTNSVIIGADDATSTPNLNRLFQLGRTSTSNDRLVTFNESATARIDTANITSGASQINTGVVSGAFSELFVNGAGDGAVQSGTGTQNPSVRLSVGNLVLSSNNYNFTGPIAEWGVYDHALTAAERAQLHSYVQDRYGITVADYVAEPAVTGSGQLSAASPALSGAATVLTQVSGAGQLAAPARALLGSAAVRVSSLGAFLAPSRLLTGAAQLEVTGGSELGPSSPELAADVDVALEAAGVLAARPATVASSVRVYVEFLSELEAQPVLLSGSADLRALADGSLTLSRTRIDALVDVSLGLASELVAASPTLFGEGLAYDANVLVYVPPERISVVQAEDRSTRVDPEVRAVPVPADVRTLGVSA